MYADRVEATGRRSVKERLDGSFPGDSTRRRQITGKRQRQDDRWEHDLYEDDEPRFSNRKVGARDLRLKLQNKGLQPASQSGNGVRGVRDLREKLSGTTNSRVSNSTDPQKPRAVPEAAKQTIKSIAVESSPSETNKLANSSRRKSQKKAAMSVDEFLRSLGLEKYSITFQAEEIDMTALVHMTDEDLKALGIPMGPRKKIILALEPGH